MRPGRDVQSPIPTSSPSRKTRKKDAFKTADEYIATGAFAMGNPDTVIEVIKGYQDVGVDQMLCFMQMGGLSHTKTMDSIKHFGRHVIPHFK